MNAYLLSEGSPFRFDRVLLTEMFAFGIPLGTEKLAAHLGPWPEWLRELVKRFIDDDNASLKRIVKTDRGKDWQYITQMTLLIYHYKVSSRAQPACAVNFLSLTPRSCLCFPLARTQIPNYVPNTLEIDKFLKSKDGEIPDVSFKDEMIAVLSRYLAIANDPRYNTPLLPEKMPGRVAKSLCECRVLSAECLIGPVPILQRTLVRF